MNPRTAFFIQGILEAAIPVYGYFEWKWDLSFILLFYLIDWILSLVLAAFKGRKRFAYSAKNDEKRAMLTTLSGSLILAACAGTLFALATLNVRPDISWPQRIVDFLLYKDMGVQQGFVLLPLIVLNGILLFNQQFVKPKLFERLGMREILKPVLHQNLLLLAFGGIVYGVTSLFAVPEATVVFTTIAAITLYRMIYIREVISYSAR